jgi:hypothetical protein
MRHPARKEPQIISPPMRPAGYLSTPAHVQDHMMVDTDIPGSAGSARQPSPRAEAPHGPGPHPSRRFRHSGRLPPHPGSHRHQIRPAQGFIGPARAGTTVHRAGWRARHPVRECDGLFSCESKECAGCHIHTHRLPIHDIGCRIRSGSGVQAWMLPSLLQAPPAWGRQPLWPGVEISQPLWAGPGAAATQAGNGLSHDCGGEQASVPPPGL